MLQAAKVAAAESDRDSLKTEAEESAGPHLVAIIALGAVQSLECQIKAEESIQDSSSLDRYGISCCDPEFSKTSLEFHGMLDIKIYLSNSSPNVSKVSLNSPKNATPPASQPHSVFYEIAE